MKAYLILTGLIGLVQIGGTQKDPSKLIVLLLRTNFDYSSTPASVGRLHEKVMEHAPRIEFWPSAMKSSGSGREIVKADYFGASKFRWQIENEDIIIDDSIAGVTFNPEEREKFVHVPDVVIGGKKIEEKIKPECISMPLNAACQASVVGRIIISGGVARAIEFSNDLPNSLEKEEFDKSLWSFRSTNDPSMVSSNYFQFASAVLVDLGDADSVTLTISPWYGSAEPIKFKPSASSDTPHECAKLKVGEDTCAIVHILNVDDNMSAFEDAGSYYALDHHFALFSSIVNAGDALLPYRKMFRINANGRAGSSPSGRCVPKIIDGPGQ